MLKPKLTLGKLILFGLISITPLSIEAAMAALASIRYEIAIGGHLKRAADANTIALADSELDLALKGIETNKLTSGSTAIFWDTPATDLGFWYENLQASSQELQSLSETAPPLERSNMLMKLRETILDDSSDGVTVTAPPQVSLYPEQVNYFWGWMAGFAWGIGVIVVMCVRHAI